MSREYFGRAAICEELIGFDSFCLSDYYNDMFVSHGDDSARCLAACFPVGDHSASIGLHRGARDKPFEDQQVALIQALLPHLRRMQGARLMLTGAKERARQLEAALDAPGLGIVRVDAMGRLVNANAAGMEILALRDGLQLSGQVVDVQAVGLKQRFAQAIKSACLRSQAQGDALQAPRPSGVSPWRIIVVPDQAGASGRATILVEPTEARESSFQTHIARLYDLTPAESAVAALLAEGRSPRDIADDRAVSVETVRTQIKSILEKTDTRRVGGLVALLAGLPRTRA